MGQAFGSLFQRALRHGLSRRIGTVVHGGSDDGEGHVEGLAGQLVLLEGATSSADAYGAVASGDFFAGLAFENNALSLQKTGSDLGFRFPEEGTSSVPDGIAMLDDAMNAGDAAKFIDFVLGRDVQSILMGRWNRRSVRLDIARSAPDAARMKLVPYRISETVERREAILRRWESVVDGHRSRP